MVHESTFVCPSPIINIFSPPPPYKMSWFSDYSTCQMLLQFLPCNWDLVQDPHQGTSAIGPGEDSKIPSPPSYCLLPNHPLRSPNRPHIRHHLTIIGPQVPTNTTPGSKCLPQVTSGPSKGQKPPLSGDWI
ncbi:hypothetical protein O181_006746 [Austropuccinia psidii MF-1]|uniref:Uncharacterized protein n=1 Tax=Austropuccinia psidii MF-1 TaxID=1389203 RepID=A0A9Q3BLG8_9BASI|nr:hypothetical protein [Austropuccinia psidii MF-1]